MQTEFLKCLYRQHIHVQNETYYYQNFYVAHSKTHLKQRSYLLFQALTHYTLQNQHQPSLATHTSYHHNKTEKQKQMTIFWTLLNCIYMNVQGQKAVTCGE